jgi:hypothetical protein
MRFRKMLLRTAAAMFMALASAHAQDYQNHYLTPLNGPYGAASQNIHLYVTATPQGQVSIHQVLANDVATQDVCATYHIRFRILGGPVV